LYGRMFLLSSRPEHIGNWAGWSRVERAGRRRRITTPCFGVNQPRRPIRPALPLRAGARPSRSGRRSGSRPGLVGDEGRAGWRSARRVAGSVEAVNRPCGEGQVRARCCAPYTSGLVRRQARNSLEVGAPGAEIEDAGTLRFAQAERPTGRLPLAGVRVKAEHRRSDSRRIGFEGRSGLDL